MISKRYRQDSAKVGWLLPKDLLVYTSLFLTNLVQEGRINLFLWVDRGFLAFGDDRHRLDEKNWKGKVLCSTLLHLPPLSSTVSEDAVIEPRTVATLALEVRRSNHSARWFKKYYTVLTLNNISTHKVFHNCFSKPRDFSTSQGNSDTSCLSLWPPRENGDTGKVVPSHLRFSSLWGKYI